MQLDPRWANERRSNGTNDNDRNFAHMNFTLKRESINQPLTIDDAQIKSIATQTFHVKYDNKAASQTGSLLTDCIETIRGIATNDTQLTECESSNTSLTEHDND